MTKANVIEMLTNNNAKVNEETKRYEMSRRSFDKLVENDFPDTLKLVKSKKEENLYCVSSRDGKTRYAIIEIKKSVKTTKEKSIGGNGHKVKGDAYIIKFKKFDDKKETVKNDMTTCAEVKAWLKTISKKQMEYLKIYDANNNECRKSAWIERAKEA